MTIARGTSDRQSLMPGRIQIETARLTRGHESLLRCQSLEDRLNLTLQNR